MQSLIVTKRSKYSVISVNDAKHFLKITTPEEDILIERMIEAASTSFESYTSRPLLVKEWKVTYKRTTHVELILPVRYVQKVKSINLTTACGNKQELPPKAFCLMGDNRLLFRTLTMSELMEILFEAGMAHTPEELPANIKEALLEHVAHMYAHRSSCKPFPLRRYDSFREVMI